MNCDLLYRLIEAVEKISQRDLGYYISLFVPVIALIFTLVAIFQTKHQMEIVKKEHELDVNINLYPLRIEFKKNFQKRKFMEIVDEAAILFNKDIASNIKKLNDMHNSMNRIEEKKNIYYDVTSKLMDKDERKEFCLFVSNENLWDDDKIKRKIWDITDKYSPIEFVPSSNKEEMLNYHSLNEDFDVISNEYHILFERTNRQINDFLRKKFQ